MRKFTFLLPFILFFGCANPSDTPPSASSKELPTPSISAESAAQNWVNQFNNNPSLLRELYLAKALLLNEKAEIQSDLKNHLAPLGTTKISNFKSIQKVKATDNISYEIAVFETAEKATFKNLVVWSTQDGKAFKEVELIGRVDQSLLDKKGIETARLKWMQLCNAHDAMKLIKEMYTAQAVYYNHKPAVIGTKAIAELYTYMNDPNYQLSLSPILSESVNENLAFEIGQCAGSYGGKYVIIWQKDRNGEWKVLMDTNV